MEEIWKDINGFEGIYQVNNFGIVKSLDRLIKNKNGFTKIKGKMIKPLLTNEGYYRYALCRSRKKYKYFAHRLVADAFIPNENNLEQINHKDNNKLNNNFENLEWCDCKYNINYSPKINVTKRKPVKVFKNGIYVNTYDSINKCSKDMNISPALISGVINGKTKTSHGYYFEKA